MSLILEALKKSDAERQRAAVGQPPAPAAESKSSANRMMLALAVIVIAAAATMGWYAWRDTPPLEGPTAANETQVSSSPGVPEAAAPVQKPVPAIAAAQPSVEIIAPVIVEKQAVIQSTAAVTSPPETGPSEPVAAIAESVPVNSVPPAKPRLVDLQTATAPPPLQDPASPTAVPGRSVFETLSQLSPALQAEIGELTLNVLVYAEQPADRFVLINLRRYQTGDQLKDQLNVAEIRADGVVLDYDGRQFLLDTQF